MRQIKKLQLQINNEDTSDSDTSQSESEIETDELNRLNKRDFIKTFETMKYGENENYNKQNLNKNIEESIIFRNINCMFYWK